MMPSTAHVNLPSWVRRDQHPTQMGQLHVVLAWPVTGSRWTHDPNVTSENPSLGFFRLELGGRSPPSWEEVVHWKERS